jgi:1-deoxy-D-xylulose-5-phosphate synthase
VRSLTLPDAYQDHDTPERMYREAKLDHTSIADTVRGLVKVGKPARAKPVAVGAKG